MMTGGLLAGCTVGLVAGALHFAFLQDLILQGELYESGEIVHFTDGTEASHGAQKAVNLYAPDRDASGAESLLTRNALTIWFACLIYGGYGLLMAATYQLVRTQGYEITLTRGALWGVAGFTVVQIAPSMGLPPNLPGTIAEGIDLRQLWWFGTMAATAAGLALIVLLRSLPFFALGIAIMAIPHVIGAPELDAFYGVAPPEVAAKFATRVLGVGLTAWVLLGVLVAKLTEPAV